MQKKNSVSMVHEAQKLRILYMGTPDFAVEPLRLLHEQGYNIVGVVTVPDKPAGRGQKVKQSAVKQYAMSCNLPIYQPEKLKDTQFIDEVKSLNPDLAIVVAFRMLPEVIWRIPRLGTFNLHASLLPNYRGAAPINWAIINGERTTGVTTFLIDKEIDTGNILLQRDVAIGSNDTAGELHDKLMVVGAKLVEETVRAIATSEVKPTPQQNLLSSTKAVNTAPKLFKDTTRIDWSWPAGKVHNFIRGLSPYPAAWCELLGTNSDAVGVKIFRSEQCTTDKPTEVGMIYTDGKSYLEVGCGAGRIRVIELQLAGKRKLPVTDFLKGYRDVEQSVFK